MYYYEEVQKEVLEKIKCKKNVNEYGSIHILAYYCENVEQFNLACKYESILKSCGKIEEDKFKEEKFRGSDWYFFCSTVEDLGNHGCSRCLYHIETLTEKKEKFAKFCKEYDGYEQTGSEVEYEKLRCILL